MPWRQDYIGLVLQFILLESDQFLQNWVHCRSFLKFCRLFGRFLWLLIQESLVRKRNFLLNLISCFWLRIVLKLSIDIGFEPTARLVVSGPLEECIGPCICLFHAPDRIHATYNIFYGSFKIRRRNIAPIGHFPGGKSAQA